MTADEMKSRLENQFSDGTIAVRDLTGSQSNYEVYVESDAFAGLTRVKQHQTVMAVFDAELKSGELHALSITTKTKS